jgi:alpha-L-fucosidase
MVEDKSNSFLWLLLFFFACPLLCCGILASNSNPFGSGPTASSSPTTQENLPSTASSSPTTQENLPSTASSSPTSDVNSSTAVPPLPGRFTQVSLLSYFNNKGIGSAPGQANFDGSGYSYPAKQLPSAGLRRLGGVPYQFPRSAPKANDNVAALGQVIKLPPGNYQQAFLLVSTTWGLVENTLKITVHYTDGSTSSATIDSPDWRLGPSGVVNIDRYTSTGIEGLVHIYAIHIAMNRAKRASSLTLPTTVRPSTLASRTTIQAGPSSLCLHVFALTLQHAA